MEVKSVAQEKIKLSSEKYGGAGSFNGLLLEGNGVANRGVVLMHGRNGNPDAVVVGLLRKSLNGLGYTTLSIENPVPAAGDEFPHYVADLKDRNYVFSETTSRVNAALAELKDRGVKEAVLLGFSMGSRLTAAYLAQKPSSPIPVRGLIALSGGTNGAGPLNIAASLPNVQQPVLDVCGQGDPDVASTAGARKSAYESGKGIQIWQVTLEGAVPHNFAGKEKELTGTVHAWITGIAPA